MKKLIETKPIECKICNQTFKRTEGLSRHLKSHDITSTEYSKIYLLNGIIPKCQCGCGNDVIINGFRINECLVGHSGGGNWQLKYDKNSNEFKAISEKISKSVTEYVKDNPREVSEETKKKLSKHMKNLLSNKDEKDRRHNKMKETKQKQSEAGILSERHWTKKLTEEELNVKLIEIGRLISESKKQKNNLPWNVGLTSDTDERIKKWTGENNYRYNPNKEIKYTRKFRNKEFRQQLLIEQNSVCFKCNSEDGRQLCLHHVDEDKTNDAYENLIFVCRSCHIRIHSIPKMIEELKLNVLKFKEKIKENEKWPT